MLDYYLVSQTTLITSTMRCYWCTSSLSANCSHLVENFTLLFQLCNLRTEKRYEQMFGQIFRCLIVEKSIQESAKTFIINFLKAKKKFMIIIIKYDNSLKHINCITSIIIMKCPHPHQIFSIKEIQTHIYDDDDVPADNDT